MGSTRFMQSFSKKSILMQKQSMTSFMITIPLVLLSSVTINALHMRTPGDAADMLVHRRRSIPGKLTAQDPATWKARSPLDEPDVCPPGWVFFLDTGNCYKLFTSKTKDPRRPFTDGAVTVLSPATYDDAASTCRNNNPSAYIAVPNSLAENFFLYREIYDQNKYPSPTNQSTDPWVAADETWLGFDWCGNGKIPTTQLQSCADGQKKWGHGWADGSGNWTAGSMWRDKTLEMGNPNIQPALILKHADGVWQFADKNIVKRPFICEMKYTKRQLNSPQQPTIAPQNIPMVKAPMEPVPTEP